MQAFKLLIMINCPFQHHSFEVLQSILLFTGSWNWSFYKINPGQQGLQDALCRA